jgi:hypothetical protein
MSSTITALTSGGGLAMAGDTSGQLELKTNNGTTAVTVTTSQNVLVGGTATVNSEILNVTGATPTTGSGVYPSTMLVADSRAYNSTAPSAGGGIGFAYKYNTAGSYALGSSIQGIKENTTDGDYGSALAFFTRPNGTNPAERMRINSGGFLKASDSGTYLSSTGLYHELNTSRVDNYALRVGISASSGGGYPLQLYWISQTNNNTTDRYITCSDATSIKMQVFSNGNIQNQNGSYGTISDIKNKENVVDASVKLDKLLALKVRNFNLKNDETKLKQIGFIAQEFEQVFPSMIEESPDMDNDGNKTGDTTKAIKTSVLIPILVKAIQELNAKVDAQALEIQALKGVA